MEGWVRTHEEDSGYYLESRGGVCWFNAPLPRRFHRCDPQTRGCVGGVVYIERCACGAMRLLRRSPWMGKNENRKGSRTAQARRMLAFNIFMCALGVAGVLANIFAWHMWLSGVAFLALVVMSGETAIRGRRRLRVLRQAPPIEMLP